MFNRFAASRGIAGNSPTDESLMEVVRRFTVKYSLNEVKQMNLDNYREPSCLNRQVLEIFCNVKDADNFEGAASLPFRRDERILGEIITRNLQSSSAVKSVTFVDNSANQECCARLKEYVMISIVFR